MDSKESEKNLTNKDEQLGTIGKGAYGKVKAVLHKDDELLARKEVEFDGTNEIDCNKKINEIDMMEELKGLNHRNIVKIKDSYIDTDNNKIYIYTKCYKFGDLSDIIYENRQKKEDFFLSVYIYLNNTYIGDS